MSHDHWHGGVRHHQIGTWIPPVPAARARQGAWRVEPRDHGMEHQADVYPQLRLTGRGAGPGCEKNGRSATWAVTTRSGRHQVPVAVLPTPKSLSAFSLKPQSDRLLDKGAENKTAGAPGLATLLVVVEYPARFRRGSFVAV